MTDSTTRGQREQAHAFSKSLIPTAQNLKNYSYCPTAKCFTGIDGATDRLILVGQPCKRWGCQYCATRKVRRLAWLTHNAEPNRLMTLTIRSDTEKSPKEVWDLTAPQVPELIRIIRKRRGDCEYLRVLELHKTGYPHYHLLMRAPFLPQAELLKWWRELIGPLGITHTIDGKEKTPAGCHIEKVDKSFGTFRYLVKYLTKLHKIEWTDRHVSYSKNFFRAEDLEETRYAETEILERHDEHPWMYLYRRYRRDVVTVSGEGEWELPQAYSGTPYDAWPEELGLPKQSEPKGPWRGKQQALPGLEGNQSPEYE